MQASISGLKQLDFCPAIPWINEKLGFYEPLTFSMDKGSEINLEEVSEKLKLPKPRVYEVYVRDKDLGIGGVVDIIAGEKRVTVVEAKSFFRRSFIHFRTQLLVYAYLVNKVYSTVEKALLVMDGKVVLELRLNENYFKAVENKIKRYKKVIESERPPVVNKSFQKCVPCQYKRVCPVTPYPI
jgi:CRISPR-associated exonuclease Cas4